MSVACVQDMKYSERLKKRASLKGHSFFVVIVLLVVQSHFRL